MAFRPGVGRGPVVRPACDALRRERVDGFAHGLLWRGRGWGAEIG